MFLLVHPILHAQISAGGTPLSFQANVQATFTKQVKKESIAKAPITKWEEEDRKIGSNFRFAAPIAVDYSLDKNGTWTELPNGDRIWQLHIQSKGAISMAVLYDQFFIPAGGTLFMYRPDKTQVLGAYTSRNNKSSGKFMTGMLRGDEAILEYFEPAQVKGQARIHIHKIQHAYKTESVEPLNDLPRTHGGGGETGFDSALPCHNNINCSLGDNFQDEKRGVMRILIVVEEGMGWCSGSLINNTNQDGRPLVLTAFHCQDGYTPEYEFYRFDFNYESIDCNNPSVEPNVQSIVGAADLAGFQASDFKLLEITSAIPSSYNPYYNGWDRRDNYEPFGAVNIHHPCGDIKKISKDNGQSFVFQSSINWSNDNTTPAEHHLRVLLDEGTFEPGSSGSPLFDSQGRIVGQLHGGFGSCTQFIANYGRLVKSWTGGGSSNSRLSDWLDPLGTGMEQLNGLQPEPSMDVTYAVYGSVMTEDNQPIVGAKVYVRLSSSLPAMDSVLTDNSGNYSFLELLEDQTYYFNVELDGDDSNGVTTFDIVDMQKAVLGFGNFTSPYQYLAADVNNDAKITTFDIVQTRQVVLAIIQEFPAYNSWRFLRSDYNFTNSSNPLMNFNATAAEWLILSNLSENRSDVNFIGVKIGDVNYSVTPN